VVTTAKPVVVDSIWWNGKKRTQRKLSSTIELFISIASSLLTDWPEPRARCVFAFFPIFFLSFLLLCFSFGKEDLPSTYYHRSFPSSVFSFSFTLLLPYTCRLFPLGCCYQSAKLFSSLLHPPRPLARSLEQQQQAIASPTHHSFSFFFLLPGFFLLKTWNKPVIVCLCVCVFIIFATS